MFITKEEFRTFTLGPVILIVVFMATLFVSIAINTLADNSSREKVMVRAPRLAGQMVPMPRPEPEAYRVDTDLLKAFWGAASPGEVIDAGIGDMRIFFSVVRDQKDEGVLVMFSPEARKMYRSPFRYNAELEDRIFYVVCGRETSSCPTS